MNAGSVGFANTRAQDFRAPSQAKVLNKEFKVSPKAIIAARLGAHLLSLALVVIALQSMVCCSNFDESTSFSTLTMFYGIVSVGVVGIFTIIVIIWRRVPVGAQNGRLRIDDHGLNFAIAKHTHTVDWSQIAVAAPITNLSGKHNAVLWLALEPETVLTRASASRIQNAVRKRVATPVEGDAWLALPIVLFGPDQIADIVETVQTRVKNRQSPSPFP